MSYFGEDQYEHLTDRTDRTDRSKGAQVVEIVVAVCVGALIGVCVGHGIRAIAAMVAR